MDMAEPVKRRYDNSRREAQVLATKRQVVKAAKQLFIERGFLTTSIDAIAAAADIPVATVYRLFGSKVAILTAVLDTSFVGDDEPVAMPDRSVVTEAFAATDPNLMLDTFATLARDVHERSGALHLVLRTAAGADAAAAALLMETNRQRLEGQSNIARSLASRHVLADGLSEDDAIDIIYTLMSPDVHRLLAQERGWTPDRYERWLAAALKTLLLRRTAKRSRPVHPAKSRATR